MAAPLAESVNPTPDSADHTPRPEMPVEETPSEPDSSNLMAANVGDFSFQC